MINPAAWPKPLFEGWCEVDGPAAAILMKCTAFSFFIFCHHDEAAAERGLEALDVLASSCSLYILTNSICLLRRLTYDWHSIGCLENVS
jgi:hypothetical protein